MGLILGLGLGFDSSNFLLGLSLVLGSGLGLGSDTDTVSVWTRIFTSDSNIGIRLIFDPSLGYGFDLNK
eukprot:11231701-Ditylum_brightwellii.AAC.1